MRTPSKRAFTLIELLIVIVIVGILAAIAIPRFANVRAKGYVTSMQDDLRRLSTAQQRHLAASSTYADAAALASSGFTLSTGNQFVSTAATPTGYSAVITNPGVTAGTRRCGIYGGAGPAPAGMPAGTAAGTPVCW